MSGPTKRRRRGWPGALSIATEKRENNILHADVSQMTALTHSTNTSSRSGASHATSTMSVGLTSAAVTTAVSGRAACSNAAGGVAHSADPDIRVVLKVLPARRTAVAHIFRLRSLNNRTLLACGPFSPSSSVNTTCTYLATVRGFDEAEPPERIKPLYGFRTGSQNTVFENYDAIVDAACDAGAN